MVGNVDANTLRLARTAVEGLLDHFGGSSGDVRQKAVMRGAGIGVTLANSAGAAESLYGAIAALNLQGKVQNDAGNPAAGLATEMMMALVVIGLFCARETTDALIAQQVRDTMSLSSESAIH